MDKIAEYLSSYAAALTFEDFPPEVVHQAKRLLIDTLGCAIGGYTGEPSKIARTLAGCVTSQHAATVLGSGQQTSVDLATFANGVMMRYLDFNDGYTSQESGHPSDAIAAVLSPAEVAHATGKTVLTAIILAYEVFCRLCDAVSVRRRGFDHVTHGVMASAAGAAKAMGLSREQTLQALNLSLAANLALYQTRIGDVSLWKGCAFANASRNAVFAAQLAALGMTGPAPIFEGPGGFFRAVSGEPFELEPFGGHGRPFKIMECTVKRFPLGLYSQTVVEAALQVRQQLASAEEIREVHIGTLQTAVNIMAGDAEKWHPTNRETADHSMPYVTAVALKYGTVEPRHFDAAYWRDPELLALVQKVKVSVSEEANRRAPEAMLSRVEVVTASGAQHVAEVAYHRGHYKNPMTDQEIEAKFRGLTRDLLTPAQIEAVLERLWHLEQVDDIGEVVKLVRI
ncbi:MAG TPA: MmgE/PrpD family protein [Alphaproteobacteria bacterium]|nr:MmgE/PrpD family protein [Alphaproteobacteria bacterium]